MTMQRRFAGPLQARGQALYISLAYGIGGSAGGLHVTVLGPDGAARGVLRGGAAALSKRRQD